MVVNLSHSLNSYDLVSITGVHCILESLSTGDIDEGYDSIFEGV